MTNKTIYTAKEAARITLNSYFGDSGEKLPEDIFYKLDVNEQVKSIEYEKMAIYLLELLTNAYSTLSIIQTPKFAITSLSADAESLISILEESGELKEKETIENPELFRSEILKLPNYLIISSAIISNQFVIKNLLSDFVKQLNDVSKTYAYITAFLEETGATTGVIDAVLLKGIKKQHEFLEDPKSDLSKSTDFLGEYKITDKKTFLGLIEQYKNEYKRLFRLDKDKSFIISTLTLFNSRLDLPDPILFEQAYTPHSMEYMLERFWVNYDEK